MKYTLAEEDYLKAIYKIAERQGVPVSTSAIADLMQTRPASVTDMLKKLAEKELIDYKRYHGVSLTKTGARWATQLIRKHRLWECFLVDKLGFNWDEVHEIAEQLEHIQSETLIDRLDDYLENPKFDPHGDPIPDASGAYRMRYQILLSDLGIGQRAILVGVREHGSTFLQYLDQNGLALGVDLEILEILPYDGSLRLRLAANDPILISGQVARQLYVRQIPTTG
ncbi:MAG: metal-dependent transcriptional regulator [Saprospiraceae bacterium]|nr:metal-dependent transcriptional regulator [Saprospiraceae bacterium]